MREILIVGNLRILEKSGVRGLRLSGKSLTSETKIQVGDPEVFFFHHDQRRVLPFLWEGKTYYILQSDLEEPGGELGNTVPIACFHFLD